jgi:hypothetical protein
LFGQWFLLILQGNSIYNHRHKEKINAEQAKCAEEKKKAKLAAIPVKMAEEIEAEAIEKLRRRREYHRKYQREWQRGRKEKEAIDKAAREKVI